MCKSYKMEQILHKVANLVNFEGELEINNNGVANHKSISIVKIKKIINWKPNIKIYEGLKRVVEWSLKKKDKKSINNWCNWTRWFVFSRVFIIKI